jgi:hypothetical protein
MVGISADGHLIILIVRHDNDGVVFLRRDRRSLFQVDADASHTMVCAVATPIRVTSEPSTVCGSGNIGLGQHGQGKMQAS